VKEFFCETGFSAISYYDSDLKTIFVAGSKTSKWVLFHEHIHALADKLPKSFSYYIDFVWDLLDNFLCLSCYKKGIWKSLKETWHEYTTEHNDIKPIYENNKV
jgi:hypothetical protein